jgi:hypothetical protein
MTRGVVQRHRQDPALVGVHFDGRRGGVSGDVASGDGVS